MIHAPSWHYFIPGYNTEIAKNIQVNDLHDAMTESGSPRTKRVIEYKDRLCKYSVTCVNDGVITHILPTICICVLNREKVAVFEMAERT